MKTLNMNKLKHAIFIYLNIVLLSSPICADELVLEKLWELEGFSHPESVVYHAQTDSLYVSNINGDPAAKDGNGFISKVSVQGEIVEMQWASGFDAPKGLAVNKASLYLADIDELVEVDINTATVVNRYVEPDALFFNDVSLDKDGSVFIADTFTNSIHCLKDGIFSRWLHSSSLRGPNGLFIEADRLLVTAWGIEEGDEAAPGQVLSVSLQDKSISILGDENTEGNLDGIQINNDGDYLITNWTLGKLLLLKKSGEVQTLLTLEKGSADLGFIPAKNIVIVPMLLSNKLIAYQIL